MSSTTNPNTSESGGLGSLAVWARRASVNDLTNIRNYHTARGAVYRGESEVYFDGSQTLETSLAGRFFGRLTPDHREPKDIRYPLYGHSAFGLNKREAESGIADKVWKGLELVCEKVLGAGGFGCVSLWTAKFVDGGTRTVVIKRGVHGSELDAKDELSWHERYYNNSHIVQAVKLDEEAFCRNGSRPEPPGEPFIPEDHHLLVLERAHFGDLYGVLQQISRRYYPRPMPLKVQWDIWQCRELRRFLWATLTC